MYREIGWFDLKRRLKYKAAYWCKADDSVIIPCLEHSRWFLSEDDLTETTIYKTVRHEGARKSISHFILQQTCFLLNNANNGVVAWQTWKDTQLLTKTLKIKPFYLHQIA